MQLKWAGANVVLLAQSHNPSILSPAWIQQGRIIEEPPETFVHTPVFSLYHSGTVQLMVEQERFLLTLRVLSEVNIQALLKSATRYIQTLPHVPYRAVGLNFTWLATVERPEEAEQHFFPESDTLRSAFSEGEVKTGTFLYNIVQGYRLRLLVEPRLRSSGEFALDFNYHFDVTSAEEALKALSRLPASFSDAEQASRRLFSLS